MNTQTDIKALMEKKTAVLQRELKNGELLLATINRIADVISPEDRAVLGLRVAGPTVRKMNSTRGKLAFWSDEQAVKQWLGVR